MISPSNTPPLTLGCLLVMQLELLLQLCNLVLQLPDALILPSTLSTRRNGIGRPGGRYALPYFTLGHFAFWGPVQLLFLDLRNSHPLQRWTWIPRGVLLRGPSLGLFKFAINMMHLFNYLISAAHLWKMSTQPLIIILKVRVFLASHVVVLIFTASWDHDGWWMCCTICAFILWSWLSNFPTDLLIRPHT